MTIDKKSIFYISEQAQECLDHILGDLDFAENNIPRLRIELKKLFFFGVHHGIANCSDSIDSLLKFSDETDFDDQAKKT